MSLPNKIILLDSDVISHFIANNCLVDLPVILAPHQCVVVDYVYAEIARNPFRKAVLDGIIASNAIQLMPFPNSDLAIKVEFAQIKKRNYLIGDGERACMAIAKYKDDIIASSNFRDIAPYCQLHGIYYLGTLDILTIAANNEVYDEAQCDTFIQNAITFNKARFPKGITQMRFYTPPDLSFIEI